MHNKRMVAMVMGLGLFIGAQVCAGEDEIRHVFMQLQTAVKARDAEKIWGLIDSDSQTDADRAAKAVRAAFSKAAEKDKGDFEKKYGLTSKELSAMNGKLFIQSNRFHGKYYEVPSSKLDTVKVKGDSARLTYIEDDGDKEKLSLVRQKGQWKFTIPMPKAVD